MLQYKLISLAAFVPVYLNCAVGFYLFAGNNTAATSDELSKANHDLDIFADGFQTHTAKIAFRLKLNSSRSHIDTDNGIKLFALKSTQKNLICLKYLRKEKTVVFQLQTIDANCEGHGFEIKYRNVVLEDGDWTYLVYRIGRLYFKLWINCELRTNDDGQLQKLLILNDDFLTNFKKPVLSYGSPDVIEYGTPVSIESHAGTGFFSSEDKYICNHLMSRNITDEFASNSTDGEANWAVYYPLIDFASSLQQYSMPGVYYEMNQSSSRSISEYFENGLELNHAFEMTYRIKRFPSANYSHLYIQLWSNAETQFTLTLKAKRNILNVYGSAYDSDDNLKFYVIEYRTDRIYNSDWHTIRYSLANGTFAMWIDSELLTDVKGQSDFVLLRQPDYRKSYSWFDSELTILEPRSNLHGFANNTCTLNIRNMKFYGNAVTTNNTQMSLEQTEMDSNATTFNLSSILKTMTRTLFVRF